MGSAYLELEKYDEALDAFKKAIELNQMYARAHYNCARVYLKKENYKEAFISIERAIFIDNDNHEYSLLRDEINKHVDLFKPVQKDEAKTTNNIDDKLGKAREFIVAKKYGSAINTCKKVLETEPENEVARQLYRSFGFVETGEMDGEELIATLKL